MDRPVTNEQPEDTVSVQTHGRVSILTLDAPRTRNALSNATLERLASLLDEFERDSDVGAVVLAGGKKVFASGADLRDLAATEAADHYFGQRNQYWARIGAFSKPTVAAVAGMCLGGGCELAMACDLIVASSTARFGLPETALGLIPGAGGTQRMTRAIGKAKTMDVILAGRLLDAFEAEASGLISRVVESDDPAPVAIEVAGEIARRGPYALRLAKQTVNDSFGTPLTAGIGLERRAFAMALGSQDAAEGIAAFLEKRSPDWPSVRRPDDQH